MSSCQPKRLPEKTRAFNLIGHLTAVSDGLLPLLGYGERLYPHFEEIFLKNPDKSGEQPSIGEVRKAWTEIASRLEERFGQITQDEWLEKHTAVSDEDFAKEPHRNRLNVLIGRTNHQSYHLGQLGLLGNKEEN